MAKKGQTEANCNLENNEIANEVGKTREEEKANSHISDTKDSKITAYCNPGSAYYSLEDFRKAIEYH